MILSKWVSSHCGVTINAIKDVYERINCEMLELILRSPEYAAAKESEWTYRSLSDLAKQKTSLSGIDIPRDADTRDLIQLRTKVAESYTRNLQDFIYYVPEGLRLYVNDGNDFREGGDGDASWHFFRLMVENDTDIGTTFTAPPWATNLYVWKENHRVWSAIYCDMPGTSADEYRFVKQARRDATDFLTERYSQKSMRVGSTLERYPPDLRAAIEAFDAVHGDPKATAGKSAKQALTAWLEMNKPELSSNAHDRISTVANWQQVGGAPKTPSE